MLNETLELLRTRRSVVAQNLAEPGPDSRQIESILEIATRVPDHKGITPWRFIVLRGEGRARFSDILAKACRDGASDDKEAGRRQFQIEKKCFAGAPVTVVAISSPKEHDGVPHWEQVLSLGAACQNLILAANAAGFSTQWLTEWCAYDEAVIAALGVAAHERIGGFIHIGTPTEMPKERARPKLADHVTYWTGITGGDESTGS